MPDHEQVFPPSRLLQQVLEVRKGGFRGEGVREQDALLVAGFGGDKLGSLDGTLERARYNEIEGHVQRVEHVGKLQAVALALLVQGTFYIEQGIGAAGASTGVAKNIKVHGPFSLPGGAGRDLTHGERCPGPAVAATGLPALDRG